MSVAHDIRYHGTGMPDGFAARDPSIEVWIVCDRCGGDFSARENQIKMAPSAHYPFTSYRNCPACTMGRQRALVPLGAALNALRPAPTDNETEDA